jgi:phosphoribosylformylglycinamidine cyclo-ligase
MDQYSRSGVNLKLAHSVKANLPKLLKKATRPEVLGGIGAFGGLFKAGFKGYRDPVLVSSMDGVGTKLRVAVDMKRHDTVGQDLINHCCNDIAVMGAEPLFFMDYIGTGKLEKSVFEQIISGLARGCVEAGIALLGGETAQMPGFYGKGDYDLVGTIVGVVDRKQILDGSAIRAGDVVIGLESTGLHTNGYTLARDVLFSRLKLKVSSKPRELNGQSVGESLLAVHRNYAPFLKNLRNKKISIHGASHITGGGFEENIQRVLPANVGVQIHAASWPRPSIFQLIQNGGKISDAEMYRVFNMGVGMVLFAPQALAPAILKTAALARIKGHVIGFVEKGRQHVKIQA